MVFDALRKFIAMFGVAVAEETDMTRTLASRHNSGHGGGDRDGQQDQVLIVS